MFVDFAKFNRGLLLAALVMLWPWFVSAAPATRDDCRPLPAAMAEDGGQLAYADAVLWKVGRPGQHDSHIFGTIHVSDPRIAALPAPVHGALNGARVFAMEAIPDVEESRKLSRMMYFDEGQKLRDYLDEDLFKHAASILVNYNIAPEAIAFMKPWAAFIIMSYPLGDGLPLDLQLLDMARRNGADTVGLETLSEQGRLFSAMEIKSQVRLLLDTLCNHDSINAEFETLKSFYLQRDLQSLYHYSRKFSFSGERLYQDLFRKLLTERNRTMVERMQAILMQGNAFIAIGAMHLPGADGVLALLAHQGYTITAIY